MRADIVLVREIKGRQDLIQLGGILSEALKDKDKIQIEIKLWKGGNNEILEKG